MIGVTVLCLALGCPWYSEQQLFRVSPNLITNSIIPAHNLIKSFEQFGSWFMEFLHSKGWYAPFQVRLRANRSWGKYVGLANLNTLLLVQLCDCSPSWRICLAWNHQLFLHPLFFYGRSQFYPRMGNTSKPLQPVQPEAWFARRDSLKKRWTRWRWETEIRGILKDK